MTLKEKRPLPTSKGTKATHRTGLGAGKYDGIVEHLQVLLELEARTQYSPCLDYLTVVPGPGGFSNESITDDGRCKMCEWCYNIVDHYDVDREVVSIAMNYLDRYVANKKAKATDGTYISNLDFQLLSVTSLFLATKLHGDFTVGKHGRKIKLHVNMFADLTGGRFSASDIEASELAILFDLDWLTHPPTTIKFVHSFIKLIPDRTTAGRLLVHPRALVELFEIARFLTELSACAGYISINFRPSVIAFAAVLCALNELDGDVFALNYDVRLKFLSNVKAATNLVPGMDDVDEVKSRLSDARFQSNTCCSCPGALEKVPVSGSMSPVCVIDGIKCEKKRRRVTLI